MASRPCAERLRPQGYTTSKSTGIAELRGHIETRDRRTQVYQLRRVLEALVPPPGSDDRALMTWRRIYDAVGVAYPYCPVPPSATVPEHFRPRDPSRAARKNSPFLEGDFLWFVGVAKTTHPGERGYRLEDLDRARKD